MRDSYDDPKTTFDTNIGGTVNVLEAIRHCPTVKAVVIVTSDKCYENKEWVWGYRENDPMGGHDPYSASKGATEIVCSAYRRSFFDKEGRGPHPGFATARAGNVIGGGDWAKDRIIPDCIRALSRGEPIIVRNPNATRPWQHVLIPCPVIFTWQCGFWKILRDSAAPGISGLEHQIRLPFGSLPNGSSLPGEKAPFTHRIREKASHEAAPLALEHRKGGIRSCNGTPCWIALPRSTGLSIGINSGMSATRTCRNCLFDRFENSINGY